MGRRTAGFAQPAGLHPRWSAPHPEQFAVLCGAIPDAVTELAADGSLIYMTPTGGDTGARHTNSVRRKATKFITNPTCPDMPCRITVQGLKGPSFQGTDEGTNKSLPGSGEEGFKTNARL